MTAAHSRGGPKLGTSAGKLPRDWVRSEQLRLTFRPGELADLAELARHWGVPVGTAAWAIVHERLAGWRRWRVELGAPGAALRAGLEVLRAGSRPVD